MVVETRRRSRAKSVGSAGEAHEQDNAAAATPTRRGTRTPSRKEDDSTPSRRTRKTKQQGSTATAEEEYQKIVAAAAAESLRAEEEEGTTAEATPSTPRRGRRSKLTAQKEQEEEKEKEETTKEEYAQEEVELPMASTAEETETKTTRGRRSRSLSATEETQETTRSRRTRSMGSAEEANADATPKQQSCNKEQQNEETTPSSSTTTTTAKPKKSSKEIKKIPEKEAQDDPKNAEATAFRGTSLSPKSRDQLHRMQQDDAEITTAANVTREIESEKEKDDSNNADPNAKETEENVQMESVDEIPTAHDMQVVDQMEKDDGSLGATGGVETNADGTEQAVEKDASMEDEETVEKDEGLKEAGSEKEEEQKNTIMTESENASANGGTDEKGNVDEKDDFKEEKERAEEMAEDDDKSSDELAKHQTKQDETTPKIETKTGGEKEGPHKGTDDDDDDESAEETEAKHAKEQPCNGSEARVESFQKPRRRNRRSAKKKAPRNELTHVLPGYTAPMRLMTAWSQGESTSETSGLSSSALEGMRRKALREDAGNVKQSANARIMAERSTTGNFTASYQETHAKFHKKGKKRLVPTAATAGAGWFNMKATPMTEEVERDMALIRNRNYLDPKRFYKSADKAKGGKAIVQAGTVIEGPTEFYSSRLSKKQRRSNLVDEVMADPESSQWAKQKFKKMQQEKSASARKWRKTVSNPGDFKKKKST